MDTRLYTHLSTRFSAASARLAALALLLAAAFSPAALAQPAASTPATTTPAAASPANAPNAAHRLAVGDAAPALASVKWLSGTPLDAASTDAAQSPAKVTVVTFWSVWSGASREAMSVLGRIHRTLGPDGVRVAAVCVWPRDKNEDSAGLVSKWSQRWPLSFGVDSAGDAARRWLDAAQRESVPTSFVVDASGKVVWIGSPFEGLATVTARVLKGTLDANVTARQMERSARLDELASKSMVPAALLLTDQLMADDPELFGYLAGFKFRLLLRQHATPLQAFSFARDAVRTHLKDNPEELNAIACAILDHKDKDGSLALDAAQRAARILEDAKDPDASVLDTLARAQFEQGEAEAAVTTQTRAVELADEGRMKKTLQKRLDHYKASADTRVGPPVRAGQ